MRKKVISNELILDTAAEIIMQQDIEHCNMRSISKELGVAVGTLYNYYKSRNQLLIDLFDRSWTLTLERLLDIKKLEMPFEEKMIKLIEKVYEDINNRGGLGRELIKINKCAIVDLKNGPFQKFAESMFNIFYEVNVENYNNLGLAYKEKELMLFTKCFFALVNNSIGSKEKLTPEEIKLLIFKLFTV